MSHVWTNSLLCLALLAGGLTGCSTNKDKLMPHDDTTMMDIWNQGTGGSAGGNNAGRLMDARQTLRRPLTEGSAAANVADNSQYTRTAANEIYSQFRRLPNPDLVMYVYPHLAGFDPVPVPGYSTVFPLYQRVQYAMPGERLEDY